MARQKVEVRREEILTATIAQAEEHGMAALRVADVAVRLGVSSGLVFYHFDTKDALLVEALEFAVERDLSRLQDILAEGGSPVERLSRVLALYGPSGAVGKRAAWTLWLEAWAMGLREPTIRKALRRLDSRWRDAVVAAVEDGVRLGDFDCADPAAAVSRIGSLIDGLTVAVIVYESMPRTQLLAWVREATAAELGIEPALLG